MPVLLKVLCVRRVKDCEGRIALHHPVAAGKTQKCKYLIENVQVVNINQKTEEGDTPLLLALMGNYLATATYLLSHGADANVSDNMGTTALHYAAEKGYKKFMKLLISLGADIEGHSDYGTQLQRATSHGKKEAVRILLDHNANAGADPNSPSCGMIPLAYAASESETEFIKFLLRAGANPNAD